MIKTTQEIIEDLGISPTKHNSDKIRDFTKKWIDYSELRDIVVQMGYQNKSLMDLYNRIFHTPTDVGEQINKTGGRPNGNKENNLECSPKRL